MSPPVSPPIAPAHVIQIQSTAEAPCNVLQNLGVLQGASPHSESCGSSLVKKGYYDCQPGLDRRGQQPFVHHGTSNLWCHSDCCQVAYQAQVHILMVSKVVAQHADICMWWLPDLTSPTLHRAEPEGRLHLLPLECIFTLAWAPPYRLRDGQQLHVWHSRISLSRRAGAGSPTILKGCCYMLE